MPLFIFINNALQRYSNVGHLISDLHVEKWGSSKIAISVTLYLNCRPGTSIIVVWLNFVKNLCIQKYTEPGIFFLYVHFILNCMG